MERKIKSITMLPANSPDLKSHEQCVYREATIMCFGELTELTSARNFVMFGEGCHEQLMLGLQGKPLSIGGVENYCNEKCQLSKCEYNFKEMGRSRAKVEG